MGYGVLLAGPLGMVLLAAAGIYMVVRARRDEALFDAHAAAAAQPPARRPAPCMPRDSGYSPTTPPPTLYGDVDGVIYRWSPSAAAEEEEGPLGSKVRARRDEAPLDVRPGRYSPTTQSPTLYGDVDGVLASAAAEEVGAPVGSKVADTWHNACNCVRESIGKATEWRPSQRTRRMAVEVADACACYYLRGSHVLLRALCCTLKREVKDWERQQQQQQPSASASRCGKEAKELHTEIDQVRTEIDEIRLQNKELLEQIRKLSTNKIARWGRVAWDFAGACPGQLLRGSQAVLRVSWDFAGACLCYLLRGSQAVLRVLYGFLTGKVNDWRQPQPRAPLPQTPGKRRRNATPLQGGGGATAEEVKLLRAEMEQLRGQIEEMKQQNKEQTMKENLRVEGAAANTWPQPTGQNPVELPSAG